LSNNYVDWELLFSDLQAAPNPIPSNMQMQRTPSIMEFQQLMKSDATSALRYELGKLTKTTPPEKREVQGPISASSKFCCHDQCTFLRCRN